MAERCVEDCGALQLPSSTTDPTQNVLQWILESKRQSRHKSHRWARIGSSPLTLSWCVSVFSRHQQLVLFHFSLFPSSTQSNRKAFGGSSAQTHTWGGGGSCGHLRSHQPAQPFVQDPAMPPLPPPNTLSQLEEACRRLEEVSTKPIKQRCAESSV